MTSNLTSNKKRKAPDIPPYKKTAKKKKIDSEFSLVNFKEMLRDTNTAFPGLEKFVIEADKYTKDSTNYDIVAAYCHDSPDCAEIFEIFEGGKRKVQELGAVVAALEAILVHVADDLSKLSSVGSSVARRILQSHLKAVYALLNPRNKSTHIKVALRLMTSVVLQGTEMARLALLHFDFTHFTLTPLLRRRDVKDVSDVRTCMVQFMMTFFIGGDAAVTKQLLEAKDLVIGLMSGLSGDKVGTLSLVLATFLDHVVLQPGINKTTKIQLFNATAVAQLARLYSWRGVMKGGSKETVKEGSAANVVLVASEEERQTVFTLLDDLLTALTTNFKLGITFNDPTLGTSGRNMNPVVTSLLSALPQPYTDPRQRVLITCSLQACPDQLTWFLPRLKDSFEPRLSQNWIDAVGLLRDVLKTVPEAYVVLRDGKRESLKDVRRRIMTLIVPPREVICHVVKALQSEHAAVQHGAATCLTVVLTRAAAVLSSCTTPHKIYTCEELASISTGVEEALTHLLPSAAAVVKLCQFTGKDEKKEGNVASHTVETPGPSCPPTGGSPTPSVTPSAVLLSLLQLLTSYQRAMPTQAALQPLHVGPLVEGVIVAGDNDMSSDKESQQLQSTLLELLSADTGAHLSWLRVTASGHTTLALLLRLCSRAAGDITLHNTVCEHLAVLLARSILHSPDYTHELDVWLHALPSADTSVLQSLEKVLSVLIKSPHQTTDILSDVFARASTLSDDPNLCDVSSTTAVSIEEILAMDDADLKLADDTSSPTVISHNVPNTHNEFLFSPVVPVALQVAKQETYNFAFRHYLNEVLVAVLANQSSPLALCLLLSEEQGESGVIQTKLAMIANRFLPPDLHLTFEATSSEGKSTYMELLETSIAEMIPGEQKSLLTMPILHVECRRALKMALLGAKAALRQCDSANVELYLDVIWRLVTASDCRDGPVNDESYDLMRLVLLDSEVCRAFLDNGTITSHVTALLEWVATEKQEQVAVYVEPYLCKLFDAAACGASGHVHLCAATGFLCWMTSQQLHTIMKWLLELAVNDEHSKLHTAAVIAALRRLLSQSEASDAIHLDAGDVERLSALCAACEDEELMTSLLDLLKARPVYCFAINRDTFHTLLTHKFTVAATIVCHLVSGSSACQVWFKESVTHSEDFISCNFWGKYIDAVTSVRVTEEKGSKLMEYISNKFGEYLSAKDCITSMSAGEWRFLHLLVTSDMPHFTLDSVSKNYAMVLTEKLSRWENIAPCELDRILAMYKNLPEMEGITVSLLNGLASIAKDKQSDIVLRDKVLRLCTNSLKQCNSEILRIQFKSTFTMWIRTCLKHHIKLPSFLELLHMLIPIMCREKKSTLSRKRKISDSDESSSDEVSSGDAVLTAEEKVTKIGCIQDDMQVDETGVVQLYQMITSHSAFLKIMLTDSDTIQDGDGDDRNGMHCGVAAKEGVARCLVGLVRLYGSGCCEAAHLSVLFGAYNATLAPYDQLLLQLIEAYESQGISLEGERPWLWGRVGAESQARRRGLAPSLNMQPKPQEVLEALESGRLERTAREFPLTRDVLPCVIYSGPPTPPIHGETATSLGDLYDPAFLLPLFCQLLGPECVMDCREFVSRGCLAVTLAALASHVAALRAAACRVLTLFRGHLEGARFPEKTRIAYLLTLLSNSVSVTQGGLVSRVAPLLATYLAGLPRLLLDPSHHMFPLVNAFLLLKPTLDLNTVPDFAKLFHSAAVGTAAQREERRWMLTLLETGLRDIVDYRVTARRVVFKQLLAFADSPLCDPHTYAQVVRVVRRVCRIRSAGYDLVKNHGLLAWLAQAIKRSGSDEIVSTVCTLWWTQLGDRNSAPVRGDSESRHRVAGGDGKTRHLPVIFTNHILHVLLSALSNQGGTVPHLTHYLETVNSILQHQALTESEVGQSSVTSVHVTYRHVLTLLRQWAREHGQPKMCERVAELWTSVEPCEISQDKENATASTSNNASAEPSVHTVMPCTDNSSSSLQSDTDTSSGDTASVILTSLRALLELITHWQCPANALPVLVYVVRWSLATLVRHFPRDLALQVSTVTWLARHCKRCSQLPTHLARALQCVSPAAPLRGLHIEGHRRSDDADAAAVVASLVALSVAPDVELSMAERCNAEQLEKQLATVFVDFLAVDHGENTHAMTAALSSYAALLEQLRHEPLCAKLVTCVTVSAWLGVQEPLQAETVARVLDKEI